MKKKLVLVLIVFCFLTCGCFHNKVDNVEKKETNNIPIVGTYLLNQVNAKDEKYTREQVEKVKDDFKIIIVDNANAELYLNKVKHYITYDKDYLISTNEKKEIVKTKYQYKKNKIIVTTNKGVYTFVKN